MRITVPREIKPLEGRVALVPEACAELIRMGHHVGVETGAGQLSGYTNKEYTAHGVDILPDSDTVYRQGELVVKVKEPFDAEPEKLRPRQILFCFLHLAANESLTKRLLATGTTAVGFETVSDAGGLPILAPMSNIAGRLSIQLGAHLLHRPSGGKGLLLGGLAGVERGRVVILGAGQAGGNAAQMAADMGAEVVVFDRKAERLTAMRELGKNVTALYAYQDRIAEEVKTADILVGAVLLPGARAPHLVTRKQISSMEPGSVVVDISVDQGGCIETTRPTTYEAPTYVDEGVIHLAVTNLPGAVPRSASKAISAAIMPYLVRLTASDWRRDSALAQGINLDAGEIVHPALQELYT